MTIRRPTRPVATALTLVALLTIGACTHVRLDQPPVEDWSTNGTPAVSSAAAPTTYVVQRGDTLQSIATRFGTTPSNLLAWNGLASNARVAPNQVLRVAPPAAASVPPPVDAGPVAVPSPIGSEGVEQRPLGQSSTPIAPGPTVPSSSNAPLKTAPLGTRRPYSDATLAELSRPEGGDASAPPPAAAAPTVSPSAPPAASATGGPTWAWPAAGRPTATFGDGKTKGIDIPGKAGDPVLAAADGKVTFAGTGVRGYGNFVIVRHTPDLLSVYAHNRTNLVKEGATVARGQKIAEMGATDADAVRLHFEIRSDSKPVDPLKYLPER